MLFIFSLLILVPILLSIAFFTLAERKVMATVQRRLGPNTVGFFGLLQPFSDGFKLLLKELYIPDFVFTFSFMLSPILVFGLSLVNWFFISFDYVGSAILSSFNYSLLYAYTISSLGIYGILLSGWASNSRYSFIGALRATTQMVAYEVVFSLVFVFISFLSSSLEISEIIYSQYSKFYLFSCLPLAIIFFISLLAETNRVPFDLPEAEAEIVAGYNLEYASISFALFFLGEYSNILISCSLFTIFFCGGWISPFSYSESFIWFILKLLFLVYLFILVRATYPRYRFDQLLVLGWLILLPLALSYFIFFLVFTVLFNFYSFK